MKLTITRISTSVFHAAINWINAQTNDYVLHEVPCVIPIKTNNVRCVEC